MRFHSQHSITNGLNLQVEKSKDQAQKELSDTLREVQSLKAKLQAKDARLQETDRGLEQAKARAESLQSDNSDLRASLERQANDLEEAARRKADW